MLKVTTAIACCVVAIVMVTGEVKGASVGSTSYTSSYETLTVNTLDGVKVEVEYSTPALQPEEKCKIYEHFAQVEFNDVDWAELQELLPGVVVGYHIKK